MIENKGIMPTKIELRLEQSQQGVSNDVLVNIEGVEELKINVWIKGEKNAAPQTPYTETSFFIISSIAVQTPDSGISNLLAVGTTFTGSGNLYRQWELSPGSGNALCILFPTLISGRTRNVKSENLNTKE
uniref:Uncharacterized protein n=1 Tax=Tanacetum cinerariifolium TaxID=118510 RepID=A0A6L2KM11_TANCI|nr:hypothetical protein [Tanacetum cinerariifolium]